jgi:RNA polymerase sigma factor (TIGR02999 family)
VTFALLVLPMTDVTRILSAIEQGDALAAEQLLPLVYDELRTLAAQKLEQEKPGQTLQATALVHEAYLRLVNVDQVQQWNSLGHFFGAAAEAMRRILVENARRKKRRKHGGALHRVVLTDYPAAAEDDQLLALDDALTKLAAEDPLAAKVVELRYYAGLGHEQIAAALHISMNKARVKWDYAKAWLTEALKPT